MGSVVKLSSNFEAKKLARKEAYALIDLLQNQCEPNDSLPTAITGEYIERLSESFLISSYETTTLKNDHSSSF